MNTDLLIILIAGIVILILVVVLIMVMLAGRRTLPKNRRKGIEFISGADIGTGRITSGRTSGLGLNEKQGTVVVNINIRQNEAMHGVFLTSSRTGQVYTIPVRSMAILGRLSGPPDSGQYRVSELSSVSKSHCIIEDYNGELYLNDYNSTNHTYLNNELVTNYVRLCSGDVLRLGMNEEFNIDVF